MTNRPSESVAAEPLAGSREVSTRRALDSGALDRESTTRPRSVAPWMSMSNVPLAAAVYLV